MSRGLEKTRKKIARKKGNVTALHENSRDSQKLKRAQLRDEKLEKIALARKKTEKPLLERAKYFQDAIRNNTERPLELEAIQTLIQTYLNRRSEELSRLKKERRPGRPSSSREDLLRTKVTKDAREYRDGFYMPDLTDEKNVACLCKWDGTWSYLSTLRWVLLSSSGRVKPSKFPQKSDA